MHLYKINFNQKYAFVDENGNIIPVFKENMDSFRKYIGRQIPCINEFSYRLCWTIEVYRSMYGIIPQEFVEELRCGYPCEVLERFAGRVRIELYR